MPFSIRPYRHFLHSTALPIYLAIAIIIVPGSFPGCTATGEAFKPAAQPPGMSVIYFFRHNPRPERIRLSGIDCPEKG